MSRKYEHLLSPIRIGNVILKNRMIASNCMLHYLQGTENFPADSVINYISGLARNGAAVVTLFTKQKTGPDSPPGELHIVGYDLDEPASQNYFAQMSDAVHFYGSKLFVSLVPLPPRGYGVMDRGPLTPGEDPDSPIFSDESLRPFVGAPPFIGFGPLKAASDEMLDESIESLARKALMCKEAMGMDGVSFHMSYRGSIAAQLMSPAINKRAGKYGGGSLESRFRYALELCRRVKELCGRDFLIECQVTGEDPYGCSLDETIQFAKMAEGAVDILQVRTDQGETAHPTGYNSREGWQQTLAYAEAIKSSGVKMLVAPIGGFQDLDENDGYIASGKCDMIAMARAFICDPEYGLKAYEGRGEDVVPCLRCNKCHSPANGSGYFVNVCSVNPRTGIDHRLHTLIKAPERIKRVAVVGGGPAGMEAAIVATQRGHKVTLFEKSGRLGGQINHADYVTFKWPLRKFRDYLVRQVEKSGVEVRLNTAATRELLEHEEFDAVIAALGAEPVLPDIPGRDRKNVWTPIAVYGHENELDKKVVVVGGAETGTETAIHLAREGFDVTVLTRRKELAPDAMRVHYYDTMQTAWETLPNFGYVTEASTKEIGESSVTYRDASGEVHTIEAGSVVLCGGVRPMQEEAMELFGATTDFKVVGDCQQPGNIQRCMRTAFAAASTL